MKKCKLCDQPIEIALRLSVLFYLTFILAAASVHGAGKIWVGVNNGLSYGGGIEALAIDPTATQTLYAGTDPGGVFKSTNGG